MVRDEELKRLIHYAKGLGVKVIIYNRHNTEQSACWSLDGTQIEVYVGPRKSKVTVILDLIHELGHHMWFVHDRDREYDLKFEEAIHANSDEEETPKHLRKKIWDEEVAATRWWESIYKETNMKFPIWKLHAAMEFDMWMYEVYYETGKFPKGMTKRNHYVDVYARHRNAARKA